MLAATSSAALAQTSSGPEPGIIVHPAQGPAVRLQVYGDGIIRVTEAPTDSSDLAPSLMVRAKPLGERIHAGRRAQVADRQAQDRQVLGRRRHPNGHRELPRLDPAARWSSPKALRRRFAPANAEGVPWLSISQQFNRGTDEGFYGLGQHQNGQMNYNGEDVVLAQHNMDVAIPFVVSTRNYGLLWDNNSVTRFGDPEPYAYAGGAGRRPGGQWRQRLDRDLQRQRQDHRAARRSRRSSFNISRT